MAASYVLIRVSDPPVRFGPFDQALLTLFYALQRPAAVSVGQLAGDGQASLGVFRLLLGLGFAPQATPSPPSATESVSGAALLHRRPRDGPGVVGAAEP